MNAPPITAEYMRDWARHAHGSPLYAELCEVVARSPEMLRVVSRIPNPPPPNVFFAAVHYLLMKGEDADLARFYPSLVDDPRSPEEVGDLFRQFVLAHEETIVELGHTRFTQTNECRRCVALLPAIWATGFARFHLIDVGASAGLNLLVDRYRYRWDGLEWGRDSNTCVPRMPGTPSASTRGRVKPCLGRATPAGSGSSSTPVRRRG